MDFKTPAHKDLIRLNLRNRYLRRVSLFFLFFIKINLLQGLCACRTIQLLYIRKRRVLSLLFIFVSIERKESLKLLCFPSLAIFSYLMKVQFT